jgi:hypothetical protein
VPEDPGNLSTQGIDPAVEHVGNDVASSSGGNRYGDFIKHVGPRVEV